jgi:hypothetical protein
MIENLIRELELQGMLIDMGRNKITETPTVFGRRLKRRKK